MPKTEKNLKEAFAGESQAHLKYLAFAEKAERDGYPQAARLFRAAAAAETVHAHVHLRAMNGVGRTVDNLKEAVAGENHEFKSMYPPMVEDAKEEGNAAAERSFRFALEVEGIHAELYQKMLEKLDTEGKKDYPYFVCPVCGFTAEEEAPETCPVCGAKGKMFKKID